MIEGKPLELQQYLDLQDHVICTQIALWRNSTDEILQDLSRRFLTRRGFKEISKPKKADFQIHEALNKSEDYLKGAGFPPDYYLLPDAGETTIYDMYRPEPEKEQQTPATAIFLQHHPGEFVEISQALPRLRAITAMSEDFERYYCPEEYKSEIDAIFNA